MDDIEPGRLEARFLCPRCGRETRRNVFPHLDGVLVHARCEKGDCGAPVSFVLDLSSELQRAFLRNEPNGHEREV
jgi:hypothetical protein